MIQKLVSILIGLFCFFSCSQYGKWYNETEYNDKNDTCQLIEMDMMVFPLDSMTSPILRASEYIDSLDVYSILSQNTLLLYSCDSCKLICKIPLPTKNATTYSMVDSANIFVLDYNLNEIFHLDNKGNLLDKYEIKHQIKYYPMPVVKIAPFVVKDGICFFWGNISGEYFDDDENNRLVFTRLNLQTSKVDYAIPYSKAYQGRNWGGGLFRWVYADYNSLKKEYVVSFPADHEIHVYSNNLDKIRSYKAGSKYINYTTYLKQSPDKVDSEGRIKHFVESDSYSRILFDKYRNVYYRFAELHTVYEGIPGWHKDVSVIILDEQFNIIGETKIENCNPNYRYLTFVGKSGLHIPQIIEGEDSLLFKSYIISNR